MSGRCRQGPDELGAEGADGGGEKRAGNRPNRMNQPRLRSSSVLISTSTPTWMRCARRRQRRTCHPDNMKMHSSAPAEVELSSASARGYGQPRVAVQHRDEDDEVARNQERNQPSSRCRGTSACTPPPARGAVGPAVSTADCARGGAPARGGTYAAGSKPVSL